MVRNLLRGLGGLIGLAALLVGLPYALWVFGRQWLPDRIPTLDEVGAALMRPDDGSLFLGALVVIGFAAWACLALSFLLELPAQLRGLGRVRLPRGMRWSQHIAGGLLAAVLSMSVAQIAGAAAPAAAQTVTVVSAPLAGTGSSTTPAAAPAEAPPAPPAAVPAAAATYVVVRGDTLWDIADRVLGDGFRYHEIVDLNVGAVQPDGGALSAGGSIEAGWVLTLPADAAVPVATAGQVVVVEAGDTLSGIAAEQGLPSWQPIFDLNAGEVQPGAHLFTDPDLIFPGQALDMPVDQASSPPAPPVVVDEPAPAPDTTEPAPLPPSAEEPVPDGQPAPAERGAQPETQSSQGETTAESDGELAIVTPLNLAGAGLLAVGVIGSLEALRRNQKRHRRTNRMIRTPDPGPAHAEAELRRAENPTGVYFLDLVLRNLAAYLAGRTAESMPDVLAARLGEEDLELLLAAPAGQAPPWAQPSPDGLRWRILTTADLPVLEAAAEHLAPLPALVTVGQLGNDDMLLDLERMGSWAISGPDGPLRGLMRFIAIELAHNAWSDQLAVTCVGFGSELVALNPERLRFADRLGEVLTRMERKVEQILSSIVELDAGSVLGGRVNAVAGDTWMPEVILLGTTPDDSELATLERLLAVMGEHPRVSAGIVLAGTVPGAQWHARIDHSGRLDLEELQLQLQAKTFDVPTAKLVLQLVETARDIADQPIPATPSVAGWTAPGCNSAGGILEDDNDRSAIAAVPTTNAPVEDAAVVELRPEAAARDAQRARIMARDPDLDEDLAAWANGTAPVRIQVMGQVTVTAPGPLAKRKDFYTELVVYLATASNGGASADEVKTAVYGESSTVASSTRTGDLARARAWLGTSSTGSDLLSYMGADGRYRLDDEALLDWTLFRRLRKRGEALDEEAGEPYLRAALELVTGRPFRNNREYAWLARAPISMAAIEAGIMDTATRLGDLYLDCGDTEAARWVAGQAQLANDQAAYEQPYRILMRAAHAEGKPAEIQALIQEMVDRRDVEDELDLHPETCRLIERLLPYQRGRSSNG